MRDAVRRVDQIVLKYGCTYTTDTLRSLENPEILEDRLIREVTSSHVTLRKLPEDSNVFEKTSIEAILDYRLLIPTPGLSLR
eukprot:1330766-Amorphochlora_amoeboformis.AAC.1